MPTIIVVDESTMGKQNSWSLDLDILNETISLRELIRRRIYQEVTEYNAKRSVRYQGLVQPSATEIELNGEQHKTPMKLDWEKHYSRAIEAFVKRGYLVLVDGQQVTDLDTTVQLCAGTEVTFFKLVPLVGG